MSPDIREQMDDLPTPCRPAWCLRIAGAFMEEHFWWTSLPEVEELLANLLDTAYLRGVHDTRSRQEAVSGGSTEEIELEAVRSELEALKPPFLQLMAKLRVLDGAEEPESSFIRVRARLLKGLWHQLRNLYETNLPPVDHSWLDRLGE